MKSRINKKDVIIMAIMTFIYLIIALINLGNFNSPQTGWEPEELGESFIVDFGQDVYIDKIILFGGLGHAWGCFGTLEIEAMSDDEFIPYSFIDMKSIFKWHYTVDTVNTSQLRFTARYFRTENENDIDKFFKAEYREIGFFNGETLIEDFSIKYNPKLTGIENIFDEQDLVPDRPSVLNGTYFDEVYFPRTALEQIEKRDILYENTHPPLGKSIIALGINTFGMNPFGWRIMGTLFGAAMIPLMYIIGKRFFKDSFWAFVCAYLMMFDFMHFTQTRLGTVDSYMLIFIMLMYYFMLDYYDSYSYERGLFKSFIPLLFSGIALGLGAATKWIALYGAFGLAVLFFLSRVYEYKRYKNLLNVVNKPLSNCTNNLSIDSELNRPNLTVIETSNESQGLKCIDKKAKTKKLQGWFLKYFIITCIFCVVFFIIIPFIIYVLSFIPINYNNSNDNLVDTVVESFNRMFVYHKGVTAEHPYQSPWYEWPLNIRPIFYYQGSLLPEKWGASIACLGHPLLFWTGIISFFVLVWSIIKNFFKKKNFIGENKLILFPIIAFLSQYIPWAVAPRKITFIYHYFSCVPFLIIMLVLLIKYLEEKKYISRKITKVFLLVFLALFILFYPLLSGLDVPRIFLNIIQWLPSWQW